MRNLKGVGLLFIDVVQVIADDPNCIPTAVVVTWTDLGETYQLERSANGGATWDIIYTGTAFTKNESFPNADAIYSYRVKVLFSDIISNVSTVTPKEQNKLTYDNCYPAFNVAPYTWRVQRRTLCETYTNTDTIDLDRCCHNDNNITFNDCLNKGVAPYTWRVTHYNNCTNVYTNTDTNDDSRCQCQWDAPSCGNFITLTDSSPDTHTQPAKQSSAFTYSWTTTINASPGTKKCIDSIKIDWSGNGTAWAPGGWAYKGGGSISITNASFGSGSVTVTMSVLRSPGDAGNYLRATQVVVGDCS